jgi:6-phosphogluconolactonase
MNATTSATFGGITYAQRADALTLYLATGPELQLLRVDRGDFSLSEIGRATLPAPIQYVVAHPTRSLLYVTASNRSISRADDLHTLSTVAVDERTGALRVIAQVALPTRPIHLTTTPAGDALLVAYNAPALVTAHAVDDEGRAGPPLAQSPAVRAGVFPHQVLMLPSGAAAVVVARGNHATASRAEEPGSLEFVSLHDGALRHLSTLAPDGGAGFGPRHLDFHPSGAWAAVSMERQNEVQVFAVRREDFAPAAASVTTTLPAPNAHGHDQLSGTLRFHPRGDVLYVVNRHDTLVYGDGSVPSELSGNHLAVLGFDARTGACTPRQHVATESVHVRTFSLDAGARLLVTASILPATVRQGDGTARVPARLSFFRVGDDGRLTLAKTQDMPNDRFSMFWSRLDGRL